MSDGYSYEDRPSKQDVKDAVLRYLDAYGRPAAKEFLGFLGFKRVADIPGERYQYVIDCFEAEMVLDTDFVTPAAPLPPLPPRAIGKKEAQRRENRRRWKEEADRDNSGRYAKATAPITTASFPGYDYYSRTPGWRDEQDRKTLMQWRAQRRAEKAAEKTEEPKGWVEQRFGVLDV